MTAPASPRQVLLDLADRCDREEPSKELDGAIGYAVGATPKAKPVYKRGHYIGNKRVMLRIEAVWLPYTTSLDAAVTLTDWLLISLSDIAADGMIQCELGEPGRNLVGVSVGAKTRALALCAAALRARAEALP